MVRETKFGLSKIKYGDSSSRNGGYRMKNLLTEDEKHLAVAEEVERCQDSEMRDYSDIIAEAQYDLLLSHFPSSADIRLKHTEFMFDYITMTQLIEWFKKEIFGSEEDTTEL